MNEFVMVLNAGGTDSNIADLRWETLEGIRYRVVPTVMMAEGIWNGTGGDIFYPAEEFDKAPQSWDHKPVVVDHPTFRGKGISACRPDVVERQRIGLIFNTRHDDKLRTEAWINPIKADKVDKRIMQRIERGQKVEVSTCMYSDIYETKGIFNGKEYKKEARNHRPDHVAVLLDKPGAYSIKDGGGMLAHSATEGSSFIAPVDFETTISNLLKPIGGQLLNNELSFSQISGQICRALASTYGKKGESWSGWIQEIFKNWVAFSDEGKLYLIEYAVSDSEVSLKGERQPAKISTMYKTEGGTTLLRNEEGSLIPEKEKTTMATSAFDKEKHITTLIGNGFAETDRAWLSTLPEEHLAKIQPKAAAPAPAAIPVPAAVPAPAPVQVANAGADDALVAFLKTAPKEVQQSLAAAVHARRKMRSTLIGNIKNSAQGKSIPDEVLGSMEDSHLEAMAAMAVPAPTQPQNVMAGIEQFLPASYLGNAGGVNGSLVPIQNAAGYDDEILPEVDVEFAAKRKGNK